MDMKVKKKVIISNLLWRFLEKTGAQAVTFVVSLFLARLLSPEDYGTVALIMVIINFLNVLVDSGLGNALIQAKHIDDMDFSTVFIFNIAFCIVLYFLLFCTSPYVAKFYNDNKLTLMIRVLGIIILISSAKNIQQAYISRNLLFKKFFYSTLCGTILAAVVGIVLAFRGVGIWALVIQYLVNAIVDTCILWVTVEWKPKLFFSWHRLVNLLSYGWKLLCSQIITVGYQNVRQILIGKVYTPEILAFYNQGDKFPNLLVTNIIYSIGSVLFPTLSKSQDSKETVKQGTREAIQLSSYILMPLMMGLAVCAPTLVKVVLTEKWIPCVPYLQIFCFIYAFYPLHTANLNAIKALGFSEIYLKLEIIKDVIGIGILLVTLRMGAFNIAIGYALSTIIAQVINSWPNKFLLNYGYFEQLKDMAPPILCSIIMGVMIFFVNMLRLSDIVTLFVQIPLGAIVYILLSRLFNLSSYNQIIKILSELFVLGGKGND